MVATIGRPGRVVGIDTSWRSRPWSLDVPFLGEMSERKGDFGRRGR